MTYKTINVSVPFEGCEHCKRFTLKVETVHGINDEKILETYYCENYYVCKNAKEIADMRGEE